MSTETSVSNTDTKEYKKVILLGMDGLDPKIVSSLMEKGELPNFSKLSETGSCSTLATSNPAQSPVAWASIATGNNPGYHGIFDFLGRRISDYMPVLGITKPNPKNIFAKREAMFLPVMQGDAFWDHTSGNAVPSTVLKWPMTFQPKQNDAKLYAGLGVPDIKGGLGKYAFYTTREISRDEEGRDKVVKVKRVGNTIQSHISGPNITKVMSRDDAKVDLTINVSDSAKIEMTVDDKKLILSCGAWSEWVEVRFKLGMMKTVTGIIKFFLNSVEPEFELYMTAVQINPKDPAFIITSPDSYIKELSNDLGYFYTLGMSEDTKALEEGRIDDDTFISMCNEIVDEQEQMLWHELDRLKEGLFAFAFFSTDRIQHMFWATRDPEHPLYEKDYADNYGHVIDDYYRKMDVILGKLLEKLDDNTALMVFSDHGFTTFRRSVHLNSWLVQNGFMKLTKEIPIDDKEGGALFQYVDWKNTKAYSLGFGSIYLNLEGREKHGSVKTGNEAAEVSDNIIADLVNLKDPDNDQPAVKNVYKRDDIYSGSQSPDAPDLVVGFENGYRASWQTAIGGAPAVLMEDNLKKWSGDHIVDPSLVPGILLTNFKPGKAQPGLMDLAPTVLSCFGMTSSDMKGESLL
jgi:predicted AlkP superfamily phosphohydrolase/phosphomutase